MRRPPFAPIRVTFLIGSLDIGGAERQLVRLANGLDRMLFSPTILCWFGGGALEAELASDVPIVQLGLERLGTAARPARPLLALRILAALLGHLRRGRPDILHGYMLTAYVLGSLAAWLMRVPVVIASRRGLVSYRTYPRPWHPVARLANRVIDLHLCNSEAVRRWTEDKERIQDARTAVIYNGLDVPTVSGLQEMPAGWAGGPPGERAAMIANFHRYKAHEVALDAVAQVRVGHPGFQLVLFGEGEQKEHLQQQVRTLGLERNIVFAGARADAAQLLPAFDFSILSSDEEGFPNVVMESMAVGVPVVATAVGGVPELVADGVEGYLVAPRDAAALAGAIGRMIEHPQERHRMGDAGRRRIEEQFSVRRMVSATQDLYLALLRRHAPNRIPMLEAG
jgi:glycosyltransferase involved in cell wall biosynthesis